MSHVPPPQLDSSNFLFDFSPEKVGCCDTSIGYHRSYQCAIPTPVFRYASPLFSYGTAEDSASAPPDSAASGPSRVELERLSTRPYPARMADPEDFAHVWENTVVPVVIDILQAHCECDFAVDVHNFPELSSDSVPRVIYITLPIAAPGDLQESIREELARKVPPKFHRTHLKFRQGSVKRTNWWGTDEKNPDEPCPPRNRAFQAIPTIGISVGPRCSDDAGSTGGFVKVGDELYAMSCRHTFEEAVTNGDMRVVHPAKGDLRDNLTTDPNSEQSAMGRLFLLSTQAATRTSLTFGRSPVTNGHNKVAMDWSLFGPVPEGKNVVRVPCYDMNRLVTVEKSATVEGNIEVYALARTSGYSLGFTSDVPGVQSIEKVMRREWTVRQYLPSRWDPSIHLEPPWQSVKQWVTSGIGVPGDSGAWLMRRSDNAVIGLIWARNHNYGTPVERVRLTYITPIVDILADIADRDHGEVALPSYSESDVNYKPGDHTSDCGNLGIGSTAEPWNHLSMDLLCRWRREAESVIRSGNFDGDVRVSPRNPLFSSRSTTGQNEDHPQEVPAGSHPSMSVQTSANTSTAATSVVRSNGTDQTTRRLREIALFGIGALARFQLGRPDLLLPNLDIDFGTNSSVSSESLYELESESSNISVRIAEPEETGDDSHIDSVEDPIRSKATFPSVGADRRLLESRRLIS